MNHKTRDILIGIGLALNVILAGVLLYDYAMNDHRFTVAVIMAYFAYTVVLLFVWGINRREEAADEAVAEYVLEGHVPLREPAKAPVLAPVAAAKPVVSLVTPASTPAGPFTFNGYTLHSRDVELKNGGRRAIYFFAKQKPKSGAPATKPAGFHVGVNERTGLPFLKKGAGHEGEDLTPKVEVAYRPQCSALTEVGHQCRNSARGTSKYCISHFGYQPPTMAKAAAAREDTTPRVRAAPDTLPTVRKRSA